MVHNLARKFSKWWNVKRRWSPATVTSIPEQLFSQRLNTVQRWYMMIEGNRMASKTPNDAKRQCNEGLYNRHGAEMAWRQNLFQQVNASRISFATSSVLLLLTNITQMRQTLVKQNGFAKIIGNVPLDNANVKKVMRKKQGNCEHSCVDWNRRVSHESTFCASRIKSLHKMIWSN